MYDLITDAVGTPALSFTEIVVRALVAVFTGFLISITTHLTYSGKSYEKTVMHSIWIITVASAVIINVIGDNFARAIGLFAVLSMIRFRTTLYDTKDTAIFFFAVAMGIACGIGSFKLVIIGMGIMIPLLTFLKFVPVFGKEISKIRFIISGSPSDAKPKIDEYVKNHKLQLEFSQLGLKYNSLDYVIKNNTQMAFETAEKIHQAFPEMIEKIGVQDAD